MSQDEPPQFVPRNGLGGASLVLGLVGLGRVWRGIATSGGEAAADSVLGVVAGLVLLLVLAATVVPVG